MTQFALYRGTEASPASGFETSGTLTPSAGGATTTGKIGRRLDPTDRSRRTVQLVQAVAQARVTGLTSTPGTYPAALGLGLSDGVRGLLLSIGPTLQVVDYVTGNVLRVLRTSWTWQAAHHYRVTREAHGGWLIEVDGRQEARLGYEEVGQRVGAARAEVGVLDPTGSGSAVVSDLEIALGADVARVEERERVEGLLPVLVREAWTDRHDAIARMIAGLFYGAHDRIARLWSTLTGQGVTVARLDVDTAREPADQAPAWVETGAVTVLRERWRFVASSAAVALGAYKLSGSTAVRFGVDVRRLEGVTLGASNETGILVRLLWSGRALYARAYQTAGGVAYWSLRQGPAASDAQIAASYAAPNTARIELVAAAGKSGALLVNGRVVARLPWSNLPNTITDEAGVGADQNVWGAENIRIDVRGYDLAFDAGYRRRLAEDLIPTSGCERNDELALAWQERRWDALAHRGTATGVAQEVERLTCGAGEALVLDVDTRWILGVTYPGLDVTVADESATLVETTIEVPYPVSGFSESQLARVLRRHVLPAPTLGSDVSIAVVATLTGSSSTVGSYTRLPVGSSAGFTVGDWVQVRDGDDRELLQVQAIPSGTAIDVDLALLTYGTGDVVRRVLE